MSLDLSFDDAQAGIAATLSQFCKERCPTDAVKAWAGSFPEALWRDLAELGVLALATPEGEGGACEVVAAMETLGAAVFPGPLAASFFATQMLPAAERMAVCEGRAIVSVGRPPLLPFAPVATVFLEIDGESVHRLRPSSEIESVDTLGGEPWGRVECERVADLGDSGRGLVLYRIAVAAYLVGAADSLVQAAADYARTRRQFGQPIGQFQAVAHPLADSHIRLRSARLLARSAASQLDRGEAGARLESCAAHVSARRAAREAAHACHQVFGAIGITLEGPAFHLSRRIMQLAGSGPAIDVATEALYAGIVRRRGDGRIRA
jgi:alkylation response protein AidB-like acyl-CoA dehydrogenase